MLGNSAWKPRDRVAGRGRVVAIMLAAALSGLLATGGTALASPPAEEAAESGGKLRALVVREAHSPVIGSLKRLGQPIRFKRSSEVRRRSWRRHDVLVVDGDELSPRAMKRSKELRSFSRSHQWVLGLDLGSRHHATAIAPQTDFQAPHGQGSDFYFFRRALEGTTPRVQMIDVPKLKPRKARQVGKRKRTRLRRKQTDKAAKLVRDHTVAAEAGGATAAAAPTENGCQPDASAPGAEDPAPPELQHVHWTYCNQGQQPAEPGYWTAGRSSPSWLDSKPAPGSQTYSWTFLHNFDVYLDNKSRPQGNFQVVTYDFDGQFTPKQPQEQFFQLDNVFHVGAGSGDPYHLERGWVTGSWELDLTPDPATDTNGKLISLDKEPKNENKETEYTAGQDFTVGVSKEGPSIDYGVHTDQSYSIPDWGVRNRSAGNHLNWFFNARHPCELADGNDSGCYGDTFGTPSRPNELSLGEVNLHASARWQTRGLLEPNNGTVSFRGYGKIQTWDLACIDWFIACVETRNNNYRNLYDMGYDKPGPSFDASVVNPIPIKSLTMKPNPANGTRHEVVTGTVTLERKAGIETTVVVSSNTDNALISKGGGEKGIAGPPGSSGNSVDITIPKGADSQDFKILTNDNRLSPGQHTTAGITAFYTEPTTATLQINATSGG